MNRRTRRRSVSAPKWVAQWLPPLVWMALIFALSGTPADRIPYVGVWDQVVKKGGHLLSYAILTILWLRPLGRRLPCRRAAVLAGGVAFLYAITDEFHQTFVPGRNGNCIDVMIDGAGILGALGLWQVAGRPTGDDR